MRECRRAAAGSRNAQHHASAQGMAWPSAAQEVREGGAEHERADEQAERVAEAASIPAGRDLHADRIDAGQEEPDRRTASDEQQRDAAADAE